MRAAAAPRQLAAPLAGNSPGLLVVMRGGGHGVMRPSALLCPQTKSDLRFEVEDGWKEEVEGGETHLRKKLCHPGQSSVPLPAPGLPAADPSSLSCLPTPLRLCNDRKDFPDFLRQVPLAAPLHGCLYSFPASRFLPPVQRSASDCFHINCAVNLTKY